MYNSILEYSSDLNAAKEETLHDKKLQIAKDEESIESKY
jgi:hypothetical protein